MVETVDEIMGLDNNWSTPHLPCPSEYTVYKAQYFLLLFKYNFEVDSHSKMVKTLGKM